MHSADPVPDPAAEHRALSTPPPVPHRRPPPRRAPARPLPPVPAPPTSHRAWTGQPRPALLRAPVAPRPPATSAIPATPCTSFPSGVSPSSTALPRSWHGRGPRLRASCAAGRMALTRTRGRRAPVPPRPLPFLPSGGSGARPGPHRSEGLHGWWEQSPERLCPPGASKAPCPYPRPQSLSSNGDQLHITRTCGISPSPRQLPPARWSRPRRRRCCRPEAEGSCSAVPAPTSDQRPYRVREPADLLEVRVRKPLPPGRVGVPERSRVRARVAACEDPEEPEGAERRGSVSRSRAMPSITSAENPLFAALSRPIAPPRPGPARPGGLPEGTGPAPSGLSVRAACATATAAADPSPVALRVRRRTPSPAAAPVCSARQAPAGRHGPRSGRPPDPVPVLRSCAAVCRSGPAAPTASARRAARRGSSSPRCALPQFPSAARAVAACARRPPGAASAVPACAFPAAAAVPARPVAPPPRQPDASP